MTRVNASDYSKSRPVLAATDFPSKVTVIPFTIATVEFVEYTGDGEEAAQKRIVLTAKEHGDKVLWLNVTGIKSITARLGDESDDWKGQTIPLVRVRTNNPQTKQPVTVLWVAAMDDDESWDAVAPRSSRPRGAKRATKAKAKR